MPIHTRRVLAYLADLPQSFSSVLLLTVYFLALAWMCWPAGTQAHNAAAKQAQSETVLEVGKSLERELKGGQSHHFQLMLGAKQLLNVVTEQRGIDVAVSLFGPGGEKLLEIDSPSGAQGEEAFAVIAEKAGIYRIVVRALEEKVPLGRYQIRLEGVRSAGDNDYRIPGLVRPVERELNGGQTHSYELGLSDGDYLGLIVEQRGIDVVLALFAPDGKLIQEVDSPNEAQGPEPLHFIAGGAGRYRLEIRSLEKDATPGRYEARISHLRKANEVDRALVEVERINVEVSNLRAKGSYSEAIMLTERVLAIREKVFGPEHSMVARSLSNLGDYHKSLNEYGKAERFYVRTLAILEKLPAADPNALGWAYFDLGNLYKDMDYFAKAEPLLQNALKVWERTSTVFSLTAVINLGEMYKMWGDYGKAENLYLHALATLEKDPAYRKGDMAMFLLDIGGLYATTGQYEKAEQALRRARKLFEVPHALENPDTALADLNLGFVYESKGEYDKAEELYLHSLAVYEKFGHPPRLGLFNNLGDVYRAKKNFEKARELYQRVVTRLEERWGANDHSSEHLDALQGLAELHRAQGETKHAVDILARALDIHEKHLARNIVNGSERQKLLSLDQYSGLTNLALALHAQSPADNEASLHLAFNSLLRRKGRVLDTVFDSIAVLRLRASAEDRALLERFVTARTQLATWGLNRTSQGDPADYRLRLTQLEDQFGKVEAEIAAHSAELRDQVRLVELDDVKTRIPANAVLIEFARYSPVSATTAKQEKPRYGAYLMDSQGSLKWVDLGDAAAMDNAIDRWRQALEDRHRADVKRLARAVDEKVMRPIRRHLGETAKLLVSPEGTLNLLPFAALVDERGEYLVKRYSFTYLTSGRDLLRLGNRHKSGDDVVVMADPSFGEKPGILATTDRDIKTIHGAKPIPKASDNPNSSLTEAFFSPLPGTAGEASALKSLLPDARLLTKEQATETALKQVHRPSILHIATHGFFLPDTGSRPDNKTSDSKRNSGHGIENAYLRSGLALAGVNLH
ncbi:MAG TPA: tetratricopeptide repeat protein, partial [Blastocatellia bacterium]